MKRFIALVLSLVMALSLCVPAWAADEVTLSGSGTEADPYVVVSVAELDAALEKGGAVTLGDNITSKDGFIITKDIILDLNDHTLTATGDKVTLFQVGDGANEGKDCHANLTIVGGKIVLESTNGKLNGTGTSTGASIAVDFMSTGKLEVSDTEIVGSRRGGSRALEIGTGEGYLKNVTIDCAYGSGVNAYWGSEVVLEDCDITVEGMYSAPYNSVCFSVMYGAEMTILSGNYKLINNNTYDTGDSHGGWVGIVMNSGGTITIDDGTFTNVPAEGFNPQYERAIIEAENLDPATATVNLYGGTFVPQKDNIVSGYGDVNYPVINGELIDNKDGTWSAKKVPDVAKVDGVKFKTLAEAVAVAEDGDTITLLDDVTLETELRLPAGVTLDGAGKTIYAGDVANWADPAVWCSRDHMMHFGANNVIKNVTFDSMNAAYGVQAHADDAANNVQLIDVTIKNSKGVGLTVNGADVTAENLVASGNAWGDVNVDPGDKVATKSAFAVSGDKTNLASVIYTEGKNVTSAANMVEITISGGNYGGVSVAEGAGSAVVTGGTFVVDPTPYVAEGYAATEVEGKYVVAVKKAEIEKEEVKTDVAVVAPEVKVEVDVEEGTVAADVVETLKTTENAIHLDDTALAATAETIEVAVDEEKVADALVDANIPVVTGDEVSVVVQPYYDVQVEDVEVVTDATTGEVASASIQLNITPMYQVVATTADTAAEIDLEGADKNAVVISAAQPIEKPITDKVVIKVAIPSALAIADGDGFKPLYVTHTKEETGVKYVYVAKVEGNDVDGYTATFENPNGFSSFTLSTENNTVAVVGDMNYATLQGAIDNAGKGAVIKVMVSGLEADITAPFSFKLQLAEGVDEPTFNVAKGYTMSKWYVNGVYTYIVQSASAGGYAPSTTPDKVVTSADTFDAGIALYVGMSVMAAAGSAVVLKKRED